MPRKFRTGCSRQAPACAVALASSIFTSILKFYIVVYHLHSGVFKSERVVCNVFAIPFRAGKIKLAAERAGCPTDHSEKKRGESATRNKGRTASKPNGKT